MESNLKSMCRGCRFAVNPEMKESICINPDMSRLDIAEAVNEVFFGNRCKGYEAEGGA